MPKSKRFNNAKFAGQVRQVIVLSQVPHIGSQSIQSYEMGS